MSEHAAAITIGDALKELRERISVQIEEEIAHLRSIGGPTGMRNSPGSVGGLARNAIRHEVLAEIDSILAMQYPEKQEQTPERLDKLQALCERAKAPDPAEGSIVERANAACAAAEARRELYIESLTAVPELIAEVRRLRRHEKRSDELALKLFSIIDPADKLPEDTSTEELAQKCANEIRQLRAKAEAFDWLANVAQENTYRYDVLIQSDYEDGVWVSKRDKCIHGAFPMASQYDANFKTLLDAVQHAVKQEQQS